jgi:hypothetical protein
MHDSHFKRERFGAASPTSTSRRMASERGSPSSCRAAQVSIDARNSAESRMAVTGSRPVAGRPLFFGSTASDFRINRVAPKKRAEGKRFPPGSPFRNMAHRDDAGASETQSVVDQLSPSEAASQQKGVDRKLRAVDILAPAKACCTHSIRRFHDGRRGPQPHSEVDAEFGFSSLSSRGRPRSPSTKPPGDVVETERIAA